MKNIVLVLGLFTLLTCKGHTKQESMALNDKETVMDENPTIRVALLLDTSNSMDGLIDQAKAQLWNMVNELSYAKCQNQKPNLKIALYEYGNDNLDASEGFIRQVISFSSDLDDISKQLFSLTTNGGNEYCGQVIASSLKELGWGTKTNDLNLIFIAGNEPFTQGPISYKQASIDATEKQVIINTIFCGEYNEGISTYWKEGADLTKGNYMAINHNQKTYYVSTPFDDEILDLNKKLNQTYVTYNHDGASKLNEQSIQDINASNYGKANAVTRSVSKSSSFYKNSTWDLVDALEEETVEIKTIDKKYLPKDLQEKEDIEIEKYLEEKRQERNEITEQINNLNKKRNIYLDEQSNSNANELENALLTAIKKQASSKNYQWE